MAGGDLRPVTPVRGSVEVDVLYDAFDHIRGQLRLLIEEHQSWNEQLETRVRERTQELQELFRLRDRLMVKLISTKEEEQRHVARELHDDTSQALATLIVTLGAITRTTEEATTREHLQDARGQIVDALENVKRIIRDLRPRLLDDLGLQSAIQWYLTERCSDNGLKGSLHVFGDEKSLDPRTETDVYRVVQEALNNVVRHSGATCAWVNLSWHRDVLSIEVMDNGQGFSVDEMLDGSASGLGLLGMHERVDILGGTISVDSKLGHGTTVHVDIPIVVEDVAV